LKRHLAPLALVSRLALPTSASAAFQGNNGRWVTRVVLVATVAVALVGSSAAAARPDVSASGFRMPSKLVTCAYLTNSMPVGLYCGATYIKRGAYDGVGAIVLPRSGNARHTASGNDLLLYLGGWTPSGKREARPTLAYGSVWQRSGYRCVSKTTGLECRRGNHGFLLSKDKIKLY
jgi:Family of unknown function (DUF6636)